MIMKRSFDILASLFLLVLFLPLILLICLLVQMTSVGPIFYISDRIGRSNLKFKMLKFRTMTIDSPVVATHLLMDPERFITRVGGFLRKSSLDELPQLWNILLGDMSLVGPRPALFNQDDLIALRANYGIDELRPGLTGWAQVNGRDELSS